MLKLKLILLIVISLSVSTFKPAVNPKPIVAIQRLARLTIIAALFQRSNKAAPEGRPTVFFIVLLIVFFSKFEVAPGISAGGADFGRILGDDKVSAVAALPQSLLGL